MKKHVYIETTIVSYLTSRPSRNLIIAGRQELTREWWENRSNEFHLYASELVTEEASNGDETAARKRLDILEEMEFLDLTDEAVKLAELLVTKGPIPRKALDDAVHLAVATIYGMEFLLTWNCKHLANAEMTEAVGEVLRAEGYKPPVVCTPELLMGE